MSESHSGGGATGIDSGGEDNSPLVECPTCGRSDFKSPRGIKQHHAKVHGESISVKSVNCDQCGEQTEIEGYELENQENVYCSTECQYKAYESQVDVVCEYCSSAFSVKPSREESARFCSEDCKKEWESENWVGENGPNWRGRIQKTCKWCGEGFEVRQSRDHRVFCGDSCMYKWLSETQVGENSAQWKGGYEDYYGPNWLKQRRKALERDQHACQQCGSTPDELGRNPAVHHIRPIRRFKQNYDDPKWYELANDLENLVTLCQQNGCHQRWEGIPLKPQLV